MFSRTLLALPLFLACDPGREPPDNIKPPPPITIEKSSALAAANQNLRTHLVGAGQAGIVADDHELLSSLVPIGSDAPIACEPGTNCPEPTPDTLEAEATEMADDIAERMLNVANVIVEEPTRIVLRLKPEQACTKIQSTDVNGNVTSAPDPDCVQMLTQVPVEIEISSRREGDIDLVLTIGPHSVGKIEAYRAKIAAEIDLGAAMDAAEALAAAGGEPMEEVTGSIRGRVRAEIISNGPRDYTFQISIVSAIDIDATIGGETLMVDIGTSVPLLSVRLDGNAPKIVVESNTGRIEATIPLGAFSSGEVACPPPPQGQPPEPCGGTSGLSLDGVMSISIGETHTQWTFDTSNEVKAEYGLKGGVQVRYDGLPLLSYEVNPNNGEAFSARLVSEDEGFLFAVSPLLDLRTTFNLRNLGEELDPETPDFLLEDSIQLILNGAPEPAVRYRTYSVTETTPEGTITTEKSAIEVVAGRLALSSAAAGKTVVVEAGLCLDTIEADPNQPAPHPFELLTGATCE
jgi:hypothetical protein